MKKIPMNSLEEIARRMTREELENYLIPDEFKTKVAMTTLFEGDDCVFVLYIPGETRSDAHIISKTRLNAFTGEGCVEEINLERKMSQSLYKKRGNESAFMHERAQGH